MLEKKREQHRDSGNVMNYTPLWELERVVNLEQKEKNGRINKNSNDEEDNNTCDSLFG